MPKLTENITVENFDKLSSLEDWQSRNYKERLSEAHEILEAEANDKFDYDKLS